MKPNRNDHRQLYIVEKAPVRTHEICQKLNKHRITNRMICIICPKNLCLGDAGGVLMCKGKLSGIGALCGNNPNTCGKYCDTVTDIFARIPSVRRWIAQTTGIAQK